MQQYIRQGKSENYLMAEERGLKKAGEVAAALSKKFGEKVSAKDLIPFAKEWHHAGVFQRAGSNRLSGKRVYFLHPGDIDAITMEQILQHRERSNRPKVVNEQFVQGWYKQYFKITDPATYRTLRKAFVGIYQGKANKAPKGFIALDEPAFVQAQKMAGKAIPNGETIEFK